MVFIVTPRAPRGRGSGVNPDNSFDSHHIELDDEEAAGRAWRTEFLRDDTQSIIVSNSASDLSFEASVNPYRGCEHGCAYCYARIYHEYLGYSAGIDFESKILVKERAPQLLEKELAKRTYRPVKLSMSGVTDCYQPVEKKLELTRRCLEVLADFRNPVVVITKNALVTRDLDHLAELARHGAVAVYLSITTLDAKLARVLEPRASSPRARLEAITQLAEAGVPAGVSAAPMIPGMTDHELPGILEAVAAAGGTFGTYSTVRLPGAVAEVFSDWLEREFPDRKEKVLSRIRAVQGGRLNNTTPLERLRGTGEQAAQLRQMFQATCRRTGLAPSPPELSAAHFRRRQPGQGELF
ncbi:MAG: PA0069 family radical SAM protein [Akkermansiaceae bacterium]|nr:PA0069 family radical SAM protein [Akkermansiaceae bacterium]NNM29359.1 PA0069 family radical SAM protein [Akkermansiaceae bacterium]